MGIPLSYSQTLSGGWAGSGNLPPSPPALRPLPPPPQPEYKPQREATLRELRLEKRVTQRFEAMGSPDSPKDPTLAAANKARLARGWGGSKNEDYVIRDASEELNKRFSNMRKAFHAVDVDNSGTVNRQELERALKLWGVPMAPSRIDQLFKACDNDGSGEIDYTEFVSALARDTVMPASMIEPKSVKASIAPPGADSLYEVRPESFNPKDEDAIDAVALAKMGLNSRFSDMHKAFQYVDMDRSGTISRSELERALEMWNVPMPKERLDRLWSEIDTDGGGEISYSEFVHALARDAAQEGTAPTKANKKLTVEQQAREDLLQKTEDSLHARFSDMRKAFKWVDLDNSGTVNRAELERALDMWNVDIPPDKVDELWRMLDRDGSGEIDYREFGDALGDGVIGGLSRSERGYGMTDYSS